MHLILSLVFKRYSEILYRSFTERVHTEWLKRELNYTTMHGANNHISGYYVKYEASCSWNFQTVDFQTVKLFFEIYTSVFSKRVVLTCDIGRWVSSSSWLGLQIMLDLFVVYSCLFLA